MEKLLYILSLIDWLFAGVILVGGWFWGPRYFKIAKNPAFNFLAFATCFAVIYIVILHLVGELKKESIMSLFVTYLFTTSFYELLGKELLCRIEKLLKKGGDNETA